LAGIEAVPYHLNQVVLEVHVEISIESGGVMDLIEKWCGENVDRRGNVALALMQEERDFEEAFEMPAVGVLKFLASLFVEIGKRDGIVEGKSE
jgi:hypothetical protein